MCALNSSAHSYFTASEIIAVKRATTEIIVVIIHLVFSDIGNFSLGFSWSRSRLPFSVIRPPILAFVALSDTNPSASKV